MKEKSWQEKKRQMKKLGRRYVVSVQIVNSADLKSSLVMIYLLNPISLSYASFNNIINIDLTINITAFCVLINL